MTRYLIRLDGPHERQHPSRWEAIEALLDKHGVKPIVAVIPDNRDQSIWHVTEPNLNFWQKVRAWQAKGWTIGVHGLHHELRHVAGASLLPVSPLAEFTGFPEEVQLAMLATAVGIFEKNAVTAEVFVAPAHGFDLQTLAALRRLPRPLSLSGGFGFRPFIRWGLAILPQQLWRGRAFPFGTWTICLHPSNMLEKDFQALGRFLSRHERECATLPDAIPLVRYGAWDFVAERLLTLAFVVRGLGRRVFGGADA